MQSTNEIIATLKDQIKTENLDNPAVSLKLAGKALENENTAEAIFYLNLTLFLSSKAEDPAEYRAAAHFLMGSINECLLQGKESSFEELLDVLTHYRKAFEYKNKPEFQKSIESLLSSFDEEDDDDDFKELLIADSAPITLENGIIKSCHEYLSKPNLTPEEFNKLGQYPDPRVNKLKQEEKPVEEKGAPPATPKMSDLISMGHFTPTANKKRSPQLKAIVTPTSPK